jgi:hypothetical protein
MKAKIALGSLQGSNLNMSKSKSVAVAIQNQSISSRQSSKIEGLFVPMTKKISTKAKSTRKQENISSASVPVSQLNYNT